MLQLVLSREAVARGEAKRTNYVSDAERALFANYIFTFCATSNIMRRNMPKCFSAYPLFCSPGSPMLDAWRIAMIMQYSCELRRTSKTGQWARATPHSNQLIEKNKSITKKAVRWPATSFIVVRPGDREINVRSPASHRFSFVFRICHKCKATGDSIKFYVSQWNEWPLQNNIYVLRRAHGLEQAYVRSRAA